jgi:hypothetical protein
MRKTRGKKAPRHIKEVKAESSKNFLDAPPETVK